MEKKELEQDSRLIYAKVKPTALYCENWSWRYWFFQKSCYITNYMNSYKLILPDCKYIFAQLFQDQWFCIENKSNFTS